ncbi:L-threonylcarbamoyladenylate synthase [Thermomonospora echinospora]|uniref:L-threonylcarbamoyladenylate synthase n=1 Tax=Thermomonospora echinospora TaxID=1992 RepID=UPI000CDED1D8|nr:L-threonylcarbamoyladenylate synthase [Thermomonospora echinospora]
MSRRYDCSEPMERTRGIAETVSAVRRGELIVMPTDTVYGIGCDAFTPVAVQALLDAKGRGRQMPPPVLVGSVRAATALVEDLGTYGQDLIDEFWPGALTLVCRANRNLSWDLGDTKGTVAVRMPLHDLALELLKETGPLAVSSANLSGRPAARDAREAEEQLGESVSIYLDAGPAGQGEASTIVDLTGPVPRLLRAGAVPEEKIRAVVGVLLTDEDEPRDESGDQAQPISLAKDDLNESAPDKSGPDESTPNEGSPDKGASDKGASDKGASDRDGLAEGGLDKGDKDAEGDKGGDGSQVSFDKGADPGRAG